MMTGSEYVPVEERFEGVLTTLEREVSLLLKRLTVLEEAAHDVLEHLEDTSDVYDGADGEQLPNRAMVLAQSLRGALGAA